MEQNANQKKAQESQLFTPLQVGALALSHRVVMAPLTRLRTEANDVPGDLMVEYYQQRATAGGLIISESTEISPYGSTYPGAPGIYSNEQIRGWKKITDAVHAKGATMVLQLFHGGRTAHPDNLPDGAQPIAPSAVTAEGIAFTPTGPKPYVQPRALALDEIPQLINTYKEAAKNAKNAGFDGVEILGAGGYILDEFLEDGTNKRTDSYGGPIENRAKLLLEVTAAVVEVFGPGRVAVRLTPDGKFNDMSDSDPEKTFGHVARELNKFELSYLHIVEPRIIGDIEASSGGTQPIASEHLRKVYHGIILATGGFNPQSAEAIIAKGNADMVAFGRHFISNPDLPLRIRHGLPFNSYDRASFYGGTEIGYTDYPEHEDYVTLNL